MSEKRDEDVAQVEKIASSAAMLRLADSILTLDRGDVSRLITAYLYYKSVGRWDRDFLSYVATKELKSSISIGLGILPSLVTGFLSDRDFRELILAALEAAIRRSPE